MKLKDIILESEQQQIDELTAADIGRGVGKVASGLGAVAGGVKGAWQSAKKGFEKGRATVAGEVPPEEPAPQQAPAQQQAPAAPQQTAAPAPQQAPAVEPAATAADANAQGPKGTAPAKAQTGAAAQAMDKTAQAMDNKGQQQKNQTAYAQVKALVGQMDKRGKQNVMNLLQKSIQQTPATPAADAAQPAPAAQAAPEQPAAQEPAAEPQAQAAPQQAAAPAAEPAQAAPAAQPAAAPAGRAQGGGKVAGQLSQNPAAVKKRQQRAAKKAAAAGEPAPAVAPSQAEIDADRNRLMGNFTDSIVRPGTSLEEALARRVADQKRKMFESSISTGTASIFKK